MHITSKKKKKTPSSQVTDVKTLRNANFADMTLKAGRRSNKGHGRYNLEIFREDANFQRLGAHNFVTISRIVRVLFSENPRRGCINPRTNLRTPQANDTYLFKLWVYTLARDCKIDLMTETNVLLTKTSDTKIGIFPMH